jgi:pimeloyl-ACP methyl ester carboxylesterase
LVGGDREWLSTRPIIGNPYPLAASQLPRVRSQIIEGNNPSDCPRLGRDSRISAAGVGSAVVSFHGGLEAPKPEDARSIRAKVLVCHGASDPLIPPAQIAAFEAQMRDTKVDWQLCSDGGAVHSFTNPDADKLGNPALAYNAAADRRSWAAMLSLFEEAFGSR